MIKLHPGVVLTDPAATTQAALQHAARSQLASFDTLLACLATTCTGSEATALAHKRWNDDWVAYLELFAAWKLKDAAALEADLIKAAADLEQSLLAKLGPEGHDGAATSEDADIRALVGGVAADQMLLRPRIYALGGSAGIARLDARLAEVHASAVNGASLQRPGTPPRTAPLQRPCSATPTPSEETHPGTTINPSATAEENAAATQRLRLVWELLHDSDYKLPALDAEMAWSDAVGDTAVMTEEPLVAIDLGSDPVATLARRVRRVAEQAFWDGVKADLASVQGVLAAMGLQLLEVVPEGNAGTVSRIRHVFGTASLRARLAGADVGTGDGTTRLLTVLQEAAELLGKMGAPARDQAAATAQAAVHSDLAAAHCDSDATSAAVVKALRLLAAQVALLKIDAANAQLRKLTHSMSHQELIRYAQRAFSELNHLQQAPADDDGMTQHLAEALPGTTAWLAAAAAHRDSLSNIPASPSAALASDLPHAQEPSIGGYNGLPTTMRTGGRRPNNLPHRSAVQRRPQHISLDDGLAPTSWQAALRCGLVHIITSEQPAHGSTGLPEVLKLESSRLGAAQASFQRLIVTCASLLLLRQAAAQQRRSLSSDAISTARHRLTSLIAHPATQLPDIAAELAQLANSHDAADCEQRMGAGLHRLLSRSSAAFKALQAGFSGALVAHMLHITPDSAAAVQASAALARCGAGDFFADVASLAHQLSSIAAVVEAVHGRVLACISPRLSAPRPA